MIKLRKDVFGKDCARLRIKPFLLKKNEKYLAPPIVTRSLEKIITLHILLYTVKKNIHDQN